MLIIVWKTRAITVSADSAGDQVNNLDIFDPLISLGERRLIGSAQHSCRNGHNHFRKCRFHLDGSRRSVPIINI